MTDKKTVGIRISKDAHEILRFNSYVKDKKITEIIDDLAGTLEKPNFMAKMNSALKKK